jgi:hypothetical protein
VSDAPRTAEARVGEEGPQALRAWAKEMADRARERVAASPRLSRRGSREKELFALRAKHVREFFRKLEEIASAVNREVGTLDAGTPAIGIDRTFNAKNLGGIEVPDGARLVLKFLDRRVEIVVSPLVNVGGRPAPVGALASASIIQYDPADPAGADWYDLVLREDGNWARRPVENETPPAPLAERDLRRLVEWLVG